jgi:hypothetical protein
MVRIVTHNKEQGSVIPNSVQLKTPSNSRGFTNLVEKEGGE